MKLLAIDSTSISASCAVVSREKLYGEYTINHPKTHSQKLMPMIEHLMAELELGLDEIDAIAVANGPGSFTGIRIGLSTAKGLAQPHNLPIIEVSSLVGLAFNCYGYQGLICPIMDARRDEVYTGVYRLQDGVLETVMAETAMHPVLLAERLLALIEVENKGPSGKQEKVMILGDGTFRYKAMMEDVLGNQCEFSMGSTVMQKASSVGMAALVMGLELKSFHDVDGNYLRNSEAEDTLAQRKQKKLDQEKEACKVGAQHE